MLQFHFENKSGEWLVTPTEGRMAGQIIASVEGAKLDNVTFLPDGTLIGTMKSIWGATIVEAAYDYPEVIRGMGVNRTFFNAAFIRLDRRPDGFFDGSRRVKAARSCIVFGPSVRCNDIVEVA